jgi:hypothetical protein
VPPEREIPIVGAARLLPMPLRNVGVERPMRLLVPPSHRQTADWRVLGVRRVLSSGCRGLLGNVGPPAD